MLRNARSLYEYQVQATDGTVGTIQDFYFDDQSWRIRYLVVETGAFLQRRRVPISPVAIGAPDWDRGQIPVKLTIEQVKGSPRVDLDEPLTREQESDVHRHYGWPTYWAVGSPANPGAGSIPPEAVAFATETALDTAERSGAPVEERAPPALLRSTRKLTGFRVEASDGRVGSVDDFVVDDESWAVRYIVVETAGLGVGKKVLVSPRWLFRIDWDRSTVHLDLAQEAVRGSPEFEPGEPIGRDYELELFDHYGRPKYWRE